MKKFLSVVLALTMALALCVPAFALDVADVSEGASIEVTGETKVPTIKISVPDSDNVILNPYRLDVTVESATKTDQVISAPKYIVNDSDLAVVATASVTGTISGAQFATATVGASETDKKVFLEFSIGKTTASGTESSSYEKKTLGATAVEFAPIEMDKKTGTNKAMSYKFSGDATANPETPWTADDTVGATIAFTFALKANAGSSTPTPPTPASDVTINVTGGTALSSTTTTCTLSAAVGGTNAGGVTAASVAWSGDADTVATINASTGVVTYVGAGSVTFTATVTGSDGATYTGTTTITCS